MNTPGLLELPAPVALEAEGGLLGALMYNSERHAPMLPGGLTPETFYSEAHRRIFQACQGLLADGQRITRYALEAEMRTRKTLAMLPHKPFSERGGSEYLEELENSVPAMQDSDFSKVCGMVLDRHARREAMKRLREAGIRLADPTSGTSGLECIAELERELARVALHAQDQRAMTPMKDVLHSVFTKWQEIAKGSTAERGVSSGFPAYDAMTGGGLHAGDLVIVAARPGMGKAQPLTAKVLTPSGWRRMGDLREGDWVTGSDGQPTRVLGVFPQGTKDVFRVTMNDGGSTLCCDEHLWLTRTRNDRRARRPGQVKQLSEIRSSLMRAASGGANHSVPLMRAATFAHGSTLPVDPWVLGAYLGDGATEGSTVRFHNPEIDVRALFAERLPAGDELVEDDKVTMRVRGRDLRGTAMLPALSWLGLHGLRSQEKFIPESYLLASVGERIELLRGLCDTDGYVTDPGGKSIEYSTTSPQLRDGITFLVGSLGGVSTWRELQGSYRKDGVHHEARTYYRMVLTFPCGGVVPVTSEKHLTKWRGGEELRITERFIQSVEAAGREQCVCIAVDAPDHLYVTDDFIVTHNTAFAMSVAANAAASDAWVGVFSLEMPAEQLAERMLASAASVSLMKAKSQGLSPVDWTNLMTSASALARMNIHVDDCTRGRPSVQDICVKARRLASEAARNGSRLRLIVVDYIQIVRLNPALQKQRHDLAIGEVSMELKSLAKELGCTVIGVAQLNRDVDSRNDKRPLMSDLRDSGQLEQDADLVLMLYRERYYKPEGKGPDVVELLFQKNRHGPPGKQQLEFMSRSVSFRSLDMPEGDE